MKGWRYIAVFVCCVLGAGSVPVQGQQTAREREQQFKYYWYAARSAQDKGRYDLALSLYRFCELLNPQDAMTKETIGLLYYQAEQSELCERYLREAFEIAPGYCWQGYYLFMSHKWKGDDSKVPNKLAILERASLSNSQDPKLWGELASECLTSGLWDRAFEAMDSLEAINGQEARCALTRANVYVYKKQPKKALQALDNYLNVNADEEELLVLKMSLEELLKVPWGQQKLTLERILALNPGNALALNNYAFALAERNEEMDRAEQMAFRAVMQDGDNPAVLDTYAWILYKQGKKVTARLYIQKALELCPVYMKARRKVLEKHYKKINQ